MNREVDLSRKYAPRSLADLLGVSAALQVLRRRMLLITIVGAGAAVVTLAFLMLREPTYTATALLLVSPRSEAAAQVSVGSPQSDAVDAEVELLRSPALMNQLAVALGMQAGRDTVAPLDVTEDLSRSIEVHRRGATG